MTTASGTVVLGNQHMGFCTETPKSGDIFLTMCRDIELANIQIASIAPKDDARGNESKTIEKRGC